MLRRLEVPLLAVLGATQLGIAAWMAFFPHSFHDSLGSFGTFNVHYINDAASMNAGIGALLLAAARWEALRPGAFFGGAFFFGFHAINHWVDVNDANGDLFVGLFDAISLTGLAAQCAVLWWVTQPRSAPAS
jgi:hypothetical protein